MQFMQLRIELLTATCTVINTTQLILCSFTAETPHRATPEINI